MQSLFHYGAGASYDTYAITDFTPLFLDEVLNAMSEAEREEAEKTCGKNHECLFDLVVTGECLLGCCSKCILLLLVSACRAAAPSVYCCYW